MMLVPLPVALPFAMAAILLILSHFWSPRIPDAIAIAVSLAVVAICAALVLQTTGQPLTYWFGGWVPRHGVVLGIAFVVDQMGAIVGLFIAVLFTATFWFSWSYFDEVHAHFHVLMLLFMGAMIGFCLTHDLFNMFVWFEVMTVAAFALTGYRLEASPLEGALNFTVTNSIGSYLMLAGIGLIYSRFGALDFSALASGVAAMHHDPVVEAAFCLVVSALLIKAAMVPFQFWLSDAHAVAPSPVSVIFSGAMVSVGIYGIAKLYLQVFVAEPSIDLLMHRFMLAIGAVSAVLGGLMCLWQRHIKRLLAFSTISHVGIMLIGISLPSVGGTVGMLIYLLGHGLVKGSQFMVAGILLAICGGIDEIGLRGQGRQVWPAGIVMAIGGALLAGAPIGIMDEGATLIASSAQPVVIAAMVLGASLTGGAVLRATGRIFLGLGPIPGEEEHAPTEQERENAGRSLWLMLVPCALLLMASLLRAEAVRGFVQHAAAQFIHSPDVAHPNAVVPAAGVPALPERSHPLVAWGGFVLALIIAAWDLWRHRIPPCLLHAVTVATAPMERGLSALHSGVIGDYAAWIAAGLAVMAIVVTFSS